MNTNPQYSVNAPSKVVAGLLSLRDSFKTTVVRQLVGEFPFCEESCS